MELLQSKDFIEMSKLYRFIRSSLTFIEDLLLQELNNILKRHKITLLDKVTFLLYNTIAVRLFSTKKVNFDALFNKIELVCNPTSPDNGMLIYTSDKKQVLVKIESQIGKGSFPYLFIPVYLSQLEGNEVIIYANN